MTGAVAYTAVAAAAAEIVFPALSSFVATACASTPKAG